jgi:hypothetical protein
MRGGNGAGGMLKEIAVEVSSYAIVATDLSGSL